MKPVVTGYCRIFNGKIILNGEVICNKTGISPDDFYFDVYNEFEINYPKFFKMDNLSKGGFLAAELMLRVKNPNEEYEAADIAVVLSNYSSSLDTDIKYQKSTETAPSPSLFVYTLPNIVTGEICIRNKFNGENAFFIQQEFNPAFLTHYVESLFKTTDMKACLTGWVEVLGEKQDVFLYLVERTKSGDFISHSREELLQLYNKT